MVSMYQPTGRPDHNWEKFARPESLAKMKAQRDSLTKAFLADIRATDLGLLHHYQEKRVMPAAPNGAQSPWPPIRQPRRTGVGY